VTVLDAQHSGVCGFGVFGLGISGATFDFQGNGELEHGESSGVVETRFSSGEVQIQGSKGEVEVA
jgi:hypothetical protein